MPTWLPVVATAIGAFVALASFVFNVTEGRSVHRREQRLRDAIPATNNAIQRRVLQAAHQQAVATMLARDLTPRRAYWWPPIGLLFIAFMWGSLGWEMVGAESERLAGLTPEPLLAPADYFALIGATLGLGAAAALSWSHIRTEQARIAYDYVHRAKQVAGASTLFEQPRKAETDWQRQKQDAEKQQISLRDSSRGLWNETRPLLLALVLAAATAGVGWGVGAIFGLPRDQDLRSEFLSSGAALPALMIFGPALAGTTLMFSLIGVFSSGQEFRLPRTFPHRPAPSARAIGRVSRAALGAQSVGARSQRRGSSKSPQR